MQYPWPIAETHTVLQEALDIALDYLEFTGQAFHYAQTEKLCAQIILNAWREGTSHRIKLADCAIVAIERKQRSNENFLRVL